MTRDGVPVVIHDRRIDRTARLADGPCSGLVESMALDELRALTSAARSPSVAPAATAATSRAFG
jgi:glycerophosphoryl diester phosphodiesterase